MYNMTVFFDETELLDPKRCWEYWVECGSLLKVRRRMRDEGLINPNTGLPPTNSAIQKAAYRWVVESPENTNAAKERFIYESSLRGQPANDDEWKRKLYRVGHLLYYQRPKRLREFIAQYGLQSYV